jgi:hypothetical protein
VTPKTFSNLKQLLQEFQRNGREFHARLGRHAPQHPGVRRFENQLRKAVRGAAGALQDARTRAVPDDLFVVRISWLPSEPAEPERSSTTDESVHTHRPVPAQSDAPFGIPAHAEREGTACVDEHPLPGETVSSEEERCWLLYGRLRTSVEDVVSASSVAPSVDDGWPPAKAFTPPFGKLWP